MTTSSYIAIGVAPSGEAADRSSLGELAAIRFTPDMVEDEWVGDNLPFSDLSIEQAAARLQAELSEAIAIGHNALSLLRRAGIHFSRTPIDTLAIAQVLDPCAPSYSLNDLCKRHHIIAGPRIRGDFADADLTRQLFLELRKRWLKLSPDTQAKLYALSSAARLTSPLYAFIAAMPNLDSLKPLRRPVEPPPHEPPADDDPREEEQPPKVDLAGQHLSQLTASVFGGAAGMEDRKEQRDMASDVSRVLNGGGLGLIEAGTGVGKSLAYLVPSAIWAAATGQRVLIATHTKNLQSQLLESDVERLRGMLNQSLPKAAKKLRAMILRGRGNYLCRRNVDRALDAWLGHDDDHQRVSDLLLARVIVWVESTSFGDREELNLPENDRERMGWDRLSAADASCLTDGCPYVEDDACFLDQAYKRAERSHLIIGNQALLITSLRFDKYPVPHAPVVIIDEAHFLEDVATEQLKKEVSRGTLQRTLNRVASRNVRNMKTLVRRATEVGLGPQISLVRQTSQARDAVAALWDQIEQFHEESLGDRSDDRALRLRDEVRERPGWKRVERHWQISKERLGALVGELAELADETRVQARGANKGRAGELRELAHEVSQVSRSLQRSVDAIEAGIVSDSKETVCWTEIIERDAGEPKLALATAPLNIGPKLEEWLWSRSDVRRAIVLTGATLTVGER